MPTQTKDAAAHISTQLDGQIALITGASSGLGTRFAKVLAAAGAQVIIAARRKQKLEALAAEIGEGAHIYELDVTDIGNIPAFYDQLEQDNILPTILVNNAGLNIPKTALEVEPQ
ncbi:MAG: SDR family NAD(P)-dependent oxidoreductase, partial [Alphaproteobacteria bacterium]|nr:SDR family NAD(P)-dependent oxidoreductase [Alphaproteobacteria bacterium]